MSENRHLQFTVPSEQLKDMLRGLLPEVLAEIGGGPERRAVAADLLDDETRRAICEQTLISHKTYLTRKEAAKYLNVSERSIAEWAARPADHNPFPERQAGGEPRARRTDIDEWAGREKQRQRLKLAG